jgi:hypothetical protein
MDSNLAGILELSLVFGSILALAIWELISLRREQRRTKPRDNPTARD